MRDGGYNRIENFMDFMDFFPTEKSCRNYLLRRRWPNGYACPRCGGMEYYHIKTRNLYECKYCKYQCSVTAGTIMEKTQTSLKAWFYMIYLLATSKTGVSVKGAARMLGISYKRAWLMAHKIRSAMKQRDMRYELSGFIELDDAYFGAKKSGKRGRGAEGKRIVLIGVSTGENGPKHATMDVIDTLDKDTISSFADESIQKGSAVKTDGLRPYQKGLSSFNHERVVLDGPESASKELPWVHILIANMKGIIRGVHHGVSPKHLQPYLSEFSWRFSRRRFQNELFDRLLYTCIVGTPLTWLQLVA